MGTNPDFIHIGPGRSGTTFLYKVFQNHPDIGLAKNIKETNFFNSNYHKGIEWYLKFFNYKSNIIKGEVSPNYFYDTKNLERIHKHFPDIKIITILRNPYERMVSLYHCLIRSGRISKDVDFVEIFREHSEYFAQNIYSNSLKKLFELFPRNQVYLDFFDNLKRDKTKVINNIFEFLCVDSEKSVYVENKVNQSQMIKNVYLVNFGRKTADFLREYELYSLLEYLKESSLLNKLLYKNEIYNSQQIRFSDEIIYKMNSDIHLIENILSEDLSHWRK